MTPDGGCNIVHILLETEYGDVLDTLCGEPYERMFTHTRHEYYETLYEYCVEFAGIPFDSKENVAFFYYCPACVAAVTPLHRLACTEL